MVSGENNMMVYLGYCSSADLRRDEQRREGTKRRDSTKCWPDNSEILN
jgi:hypothetical protein